MNNLLVRLLNRARLLPLLNVRSGITLLGKPMRVPIRNSLGYSLLHSFEPWMAQLLKRMSPLFPGQFVDIGVNLGQTLIKAKAAFKDLQYTGFEPNPHCVAYVDELIKTNQWKNCNLVPVGISENTEVLKLNFFYSQSVDPSASILPDFRKDQAVDHYIYIPVVNENHLKGLLPEVNNCFVKIDVEGAELEVMKGLYNWIRKFRPLFIIEILPVYSKENQYRLNRQQKLEELLSTLEYSILRIGKGRLELKELQGIEIHDDIEKCDYILCPREMKTDVLNQING